MRLENNWSHGMKSVLSAREKKSHLCGLCAPNISNEVNSSCFTMFYFYPCPYGYYNILAF
jgi:hypothetical protein